MESTTSEIKLRCFYKRASAYFDLKMYAEANGDLNEVLLGDPNSVPARILLGKSLKMIDELKKAETSVKLLKNFHIFLIISLYL